MELVNYWINSSDEDYDTMQYLFKGGKNSYCLFFGHLVIEKLLKALYAKDNPNEPYSVKSHNLLLLAEKCKLNLTDNQIKKLQIITQFNISARYDDYKQSFSSKCTNEWTTEQIKNIDEVQLWLKKMLIKK